METGSMTYLITIAAAASVQHIYILLTFFLADLSLSLHLAD